jgi:hypothetical protein
MAYARRIYRKIYWNRVVLLIAALSFIVCAVILGLVYGLGAGKSGGAAAQTVPPYSYYAVSTGTYPTRAEAVTAGMTLRQRGGAGYILTDENGFTVLASVYQKEGDAQTVADRLTAEGTAAEVYVCAAPALRLSYPDGAVPDAAYLELFAAPHAWFEPLARLDADLTRGDASEGYAALTVSRLSSRVSGGFARLPLYAGYPAADELGELYARLTQAFSDAAAYTFSPSLSVNIKYLMCGISDAYAKCAAVLAAL